MTKHNLLYHC